MRAAIIFFASPGPRVLCDAVHGCMQLGSRGADDGMAVSFFFFLGVCVCVFALDIFFLNMFFNFSFFCGLCSFFFSFFFP